MRKGYALSVPFITQKGILKAPPFARALNMAVTWTALCKDRAALTCI